MPTTGTHDEYWFASLGGHHANWCYKIGIIRDYSSSLKPPGPCIIQEMGCKIHIGSLFFHRVEFSNYCIR